MDENIELFANPIVNNLTTELSKSGFEHRKEILKTHGKIIHQWVRGNDWKRDLVQMAYLSKEPRDCNLSLFVYLLVDNNEGLLQAESVSNVMDKKGDYVFASFFKKNRATNVTQKIVNDAVLSLLWFEQFNDKQKCLSLIESGKAGITSNGAMYSKVVELLKSI